MEERLAITCNVVVRDEEVQGARPTRQLTFEEIPRIGESIAFSRDGKRDEKGVLHGERFKIKDICHLAGNDGTGPMTFLFVEACGDDHRT
jgi:hypothetical protein